MASACRSLEERNTAPQGHAVSDQFSFAHRLLGSNASITARMTSMTGIITYPPPDHDEIVPGLVPWAKAASDQGRPHPGLLLRGAHGHRQQWGGLQNDYVHDTAGRLAACRRRHHAGSA